jgi:hypothetical protein
VSEQSWERRSERCIHLSEAAEIMGVSKDAVRMRVKRGTLRSEKGEDGRVYVWVNVIPDADPDGVHPKSQDEGSRARVALAEEMREQVLYLREQLRREQDAHAEARRIIAALTQRIPEIEAPRVSESPEERSETPSHGPHYPRPGRGRRTALLVAKDLPRGVGGG